MEIIYRATSTAVYLPDLKLETLPATPIEAKVPGSIDAPFQGEIWDISGSELDYNYAEVVEVMKSKGFWYMLMKPCKIVRVK